MHRIRNILVFGGTGFLGRALLEQLVRRSGGAGGRLVVPTRRAGRGDLVRALPTVEVVLGEFDEPARLDTLFFAADPARRIDACIPRMCSGPSFASWIFPSCGTSHWVTYAR